MNITFLGAARMVTGSCYLLESRNLKILVDCGMFQGGKKEEAYNFMNFPFNASEIDYLLLTHAHIDHSGRIPLLCKSGFKGKILCTKATADLCSIMLPDSAHIQETEAEWASRKAMRAGKPLVKPLYTISDSEYSMNFFEPVPYNKIIRLNDYISVRFQDAGHILGSSIIELWDKESDLKLVFSGDIGNKNQPIIKDPTYISEADYIFVESTYGNKIHRDKANRAYKLWQIIQDTFSKKGNVIIPAFAVGRTQELLYELNSILEVKKAPIIPVYIDSPLAIKATEIFRRDVYEYYDKDALNLLKHGDDPLAFPGLHFTITAEESKQLNSITDGAVIIAASGMCDAGRIKHHLKHNLWRPECSVVFVGYQAEGTLGRQILDGAKMVKIFGEDIAVKAFIYHIDSFSAHADKIGLLDWIQHFRTKPRQIFVVHGEDDAISSLVMDIHNKLNINTTVPYLGQTYRLF